MKNIISLEASEIEFVGGAGECGEAITGAVAAALGTAAALITAPLTFGGSLAVAAMGGTATGIMIGSAEKACSAG